MLETACKLPRAMLKSQGTILEVNMLDNMFGLTLAASSTGVTAIPYETRIAVLTAFTILMVIASIALIVIVLMQKGTNENVGVITGASDTFYGKNKEKGKAGMLKKITFILFAFLMVCAIIVFVIMQFETY
jgi:preprotein translocase subunit SecG